MKNMMELDSFGWILHGIVNKQISLGFNEEENDKKDDKNWIKKEVKRWFICAKNMYNSVVHKSKYIFPLSPNRILKMKYHVQRLFKTWSENKI